MAYAGFKHVTFQCEGSLRKNVHLRVHCVLNQYRTLYNPALMNNN